MSRAEGRRMLTRARFPFDKDAVIFTSYEPFRAPGPPAESPYVFRPAIVRPHAGPFTDFVSWPEWVGYDWIAAARLATKGYYWGLLDFAVEGRSSEILVVGSEDAGKTWQTLAIVKKSYFADELGEFGMADDGQGYITFKRSGEGTDPRRGIDLISTEDFGHHWKPGPYLASDLEAATRSEEPCAFGIRPGLKIPAKCALPAASRR